MAVSPGVYNVEIQRRADWSVMLQFKDSTNSPINLTGFTVYAQAQDESRSGKRELRGCLYKPSRRKSHH